MALLEERQCEGCPIEKRNEWGCYAVKYRTVGENEDERAGWLYPATVPMDISGQTTYACPRQHIRENEGWWNRLLMMYQAYKSGHLPDVGGVTDQANGAMELMTLLSGMFAEAGQQAKSKGEPVR